MIVNAHIDLIKHYLIKHYQQDRALLYVFSHGFEMLSVLGTSPEYISVPKKKKI